MSKILKKYKQVLKCLDNSPVLIEVDNSFHQLEKFIHVKDYFRNPCFLKNDNYLFIVEKYKKIEYIENKNLNIISSLLYKDKLYGRVIVKDKDILNIDKEKITYQHFSCL